MKTKDQIKSRITKLERMLEDSEPYEVFGCDRPKCQAEIKALKWVIDLEDKVLPNSYSHTITEVDT
jgi:hypothetical protein